MTLLTLTIGTWKPAIGDPSLMGWFTVFSYDLAAVLCLIKMISQRLPQEKSRRHFWGFLCLALIALGLQKQFNLFTAITETGRIIARASGWMEQHRSIQALAMLLVFGIGLTFSAMLYRRFAPSFSFREKIALIGLSYLTLFVILRAISLHQFGAILGYEILGVRVNWIAELIGIYWICLAIILPIQSESSG
jgi:hypothetical protein